MPDAGQIRVGPAGWSYEDWKGTVYPETVRRFDPLEYLAGFFDTIEVNSSFYRIPPVAHSTSWARRVDRNERFRFTTKLFRGFTHDSPFPAAAEVEAFHAYLRPLADAGRLGAVLAQFPWSFRDGHDARCRIDAIRESLPDVPLAVEIRHGSFAKDEFFAYLDGIGVGFANIDQPIIGDSFRPTSIVTGPVGYIRLHGRNYAKWFDHEESWERYDYLYSTDELSPWIDRIRIAAEKKDVYVVTNNHFRGQAIVNAIELKRGLGQDAAVPPPLRSHYGDRF
jgi:uncharacterized protein YecE (DUF72 family)